MARCRRVPTATQADHSGAATASLFGTLLLILLACPIWAQQQPNTEQQGGDATAAPSRGVQPITNMVWCPPGVFTMGSRDDERGRSGREGPQTRVALTRGFWLGKYEVTIDEFRHFLLSGRGLRYVQWDQSDCPIRQDATFSLRGNPTGQYGDQPMVRVSWAGAREYCEWLTDRELAAGRLSAKYEYRLPTEAEWEYACRAGTLTRFSFGDALQCPDSGCGFCAEADQYMWWCGNANGHAERVGQKRPNPWGLYDMHGNVWEWCGDSFWWWYPGGTVTNYTGRAEYDHRKVIRGGSYMDYAKTCRSAWRIGVTWSVGTSGVGFRIALAAIPDPANAEPSDPTNGSRLVRSQTTTNSAAAGSGR